MTLLVSDTIVDFSVADDTIDLSDAFYSIDTAANFFTTGSAATDKTRIIYDSATGALYYDADGTGSNDAPVKLATMSAGLALTSSDFLIV